MRQYNVWWLTIALIHLKDAECGGGSFHDTALSTIKDSPVPRDLADTFYSPLITYTEAQCRVLELGAAIARCGKFHICLRDGLSWRELATQAKVLREAIESQLCDRRFAVVQTAKAKIFDEVSKDWAIVWEKFPSSQKDSKFAVECYALEQDTACVFHLMRVAEYGLRALARERKVKLPKNRPLEWAEWNEIIVAIGKKVDAIANQKRGPKRDAALEFYRGALGQFQAFKDAYRNHVMHARGIYDEHQAASVLSHVRDFMSRLAVKTEENPKRSIDWSKGQ